MEAAVPVSAARKFALLKGDVKSVLVKPLSSNVTLPPLFTVTLSPYTAGIDRATTEANIRRVRISSPPISTAIAGRQWSLAACPILLKTQQLSIQRVCGRRLGRCAG